MENILKHKYRRFFLDDKAIGGYAEKVQSCQRENNRGRNQAFQEE